MYANSMYENSIALHKNLDLSKEDNILTFLENNLDKQECKLQMFNYGISKEFNDLHIIESAYTFIHLMYKDELYLVRLAIEDFICPDEEVDERWWYGSLVISIDETTLVELTHVFVDEDLNVLPITSTDQELYSRVATLYNRIRDKIREEQLEYKNNPPMKLFKDFNIN